MLALGGRCWKAVTATTREFFSNDKTKRLSSKRLLAFTGACLFAFNSALCAYVILFVLDKYGYVGLREINLGWFLVGDITSVGMAAPLAIEAFKDSGKDSDLPNE